MKTVLSEKATIRRSEAIIAGDIDGETVMINIEDGNYHAFNETGNRIWRELEAPKKVNELVDVLSREYSVDRETILTEVRGFLDRLLERRIVEVDE